MRRRSESGPRTGWTAAARRERIVTNLRPARRRPGWLDVFLDGAFLCRLPERQIREIGLRQGEPLPEIHPRSLREVAEREEAVRVALAYLARQARSRLQVERYLRRRGFGAGPIREAVARCSARGYLDDRAYAEGFVLDRIRYRPRSVSMLKAELARQGIRGPEAEAAIHAAMTEAGVSESDLLLRAAEKGWRRLRSVEPLRARRRLLAYLGRRGFRHADAAKVVERVAEGRDTRPPVD